MASATKRPPRLLPPEVKDALAEACKPPSSQTKVALALKVSTSVVSQLLTDKYPGDTPTMAERIQGLYMSATVQCPVMGELGRNHCLEYQRRPAAFTNPTRAALNQACKTCPNRKEVS